MVHQVGEVDADGCLDGRVSPEQDAQVGEDDAVESVLLVVSGVRCLRVPERPERKEEAEKGGGGGDPPNPSNTSGLTTFFFFCAR